jgi:hypothetical protein
MNPPQPNPPPHALPPLSPPPYDEENPLPTEENDPLVGFRQMIRDTNAAHRWDALNQQMAQSARYLFMQATSHYRFLRTLFGMGTTLCIQLCSEYLCYILLCMHDALTRGWLRSLTLSRQPEFHAGHSTGLSRNSHTLPALAVTRLSLCA